MKAAERIKSHNIYEIISRFYQATWKRRRGEDYWALSPFHTEKTPSFHVHVERGFFKCFSTGLSGTAIDFVIHYQGLPEDNPRLAMQAIYDVMGWEWETNADYDRRPATRKWFAQWAYDNLVSNHISVVAHLMTERKLTTATIRGNLIGYVDYSDPIPGDMQDDLQRAGLVNIKEDGTAYWSFGGRIIFPYLNFGSVLGFTGRDMLGGKRRPKYKNSSEEDGFDKSKTMYGLSDARRAAQHKNRIILVEGQMDRLGLAEAGVRESLAPGGTSFTDGHAKIIAGINVPTYIWYDGDSAGVKAAVKTIKKLLSHGVVPKVIRDQSQASDPDDIRKEVDDINHYIDQNSYEVHELYYNLGYSKAEPSRRPIHIKGFMDVVNSCLDKFMAISLVEGFCELAGLHETDLTKYVKVEDPIALIHTSTRTDSEWKIMQHIFNNNEQDIPRISEMLGPGYIFFDSALQYIWHKIKNGQEITPDIHDSDAGPLYADLVSDYNRTYLNPPQLSLICGMQRAEFIRRTRHRLGDMLGKGEIDAEYAIEQLKNIGIAT